MPQLDLATLEIQVIAVMLSFAAVHFTTLTAIIPLIGFPFAIRTSLLEKNMRCFLRARKFEYNRQVFFKKKVAFHLEAVMLYTHAFMILQTLPFSSEISKNYKIFLNDVYVPYIIPKLKTLQKLSKIQ